MMTSLKQQLFSSIAKGFINLLFILIDRCDVSFGMAGNPVKVAKLTIRDTNIGGIDISVDDPGNFVIRMKFLSHLIRHIHQFRCWSIFKKILAFLFVKEFKIKSPLKQIISVHKKGRKREIMEFNSSFLKGKPYQKYFN